MNAVFRPPAGLLQPVGERAPTPVSSPWPLAEPTGSTKPSRRDLRAVHQALSRVTLSPGTSLRLLLVEDYSGSMMSVAGPRQACVQGLIHWAQRNLGIDDEIGVVAFGGDASVRLNPLPVREKNILKDPALTSYATMLGPTWQLVAGFPRTEKITLAVLVSDGLVSDLTGSGSRANAAAAGITGVTLLIPSESSFNNDIPSSWAAAFPDDPARIVDTSAPALATAIVASLSALTGRTVNGIGPADAMHDTGSKEQL